MTLHDKAPFEDYMAGVRRQLRRLATRVGEGDQLNLAEMVSLRGELEDHITEAIRGQRHNSDLPASWTDIGEALGITRQAAQKRYGHVGGLRRASGQPAEWR